MESCACKTGEECEILKYSATEWMTKDHKTEKEIEIFRS